MLVIKIFLSTMIIGVGFGLVVRACYRAWRRAVERRQRRRLIEAHYHLLEPNGPSRAVPVWIALIQLLALWLMIRGDPKAFEGRAALALFLSLLLLLFAFCSHGLPRHNRSAKYVALCLGAFLASAGIFSVQNHDLGDVAWTFAILPASVLAAAVLSYVLRNRNWGRDRARLLAFAIHRINMALGPASGIRAAITFLAMRSSGAIMGYLMVRYFVRPYVSQRPFLYLRSFADSSARTFFGTVLAPSAGARGVVVGLIHEQQTGEELHRDTEEAWRADVFVLPNSAWKAWVQDHLGSCTGVVIDMSMPSDSVAWEFEQARQRLPPERVLVVSRGQIPDHVAATGVPILNYSLDSRSHRRRAANALLGWADRAVRTSLCADTIEWPMLSASATLFPVAFTAILLWAGISVAVVFAQAGMFTDVISNPRSYESVLRTAQVWASYEQVVHMIAALLFLFASPLFPLEGPSSMRASRSWLVVPCLVIGISNLLALCVGHGYVPVVVDVICEPAFFFVMGYVILSCVMAHIQTAADIKLERLVLGLLAPAAMQFVTTFALPKFAIISRTPALLWFGAILQVASDCVAVYTFITLIRSAMLLRTVRMPSVPQAA